jgi:hypothetical protein
MISSNASSGAAAITACINNDEQLHNLYDGSDLEESYAELRLLVNDAVYSRQTPLLPLRQKVSLDDLFEDPSRECAKVFTSMYTWEFNALTPYIV